MRWLKTREWGRRAGKIGLFDATPKGSSSRIKSAGPWGKNLFQAHRNSMSQYSWNSIKRGNLVITEKSVDPSAFPFWLLFSSRVSLQLFVLSSFISLFLLLGHTNGNTGLWLHCGQENEDHTGAMNCSTVPLPPLLLMGHGNLTNNGNDWRDGGCTEEDRKRRTGNHVLKETEEKWACTDWEETVVKLQKLWNENLEICHAAEG